MTKKSNADSVLIYGPPGCGKTFNSKELLKRFKLSVLIDGWDGSTEIPKRGALILTNTKPEKGLGGIKIMSFNKLGIRK